MGIRKPPLVPKKTKGEEREIRSFLLREYLPFCIEMKDDQYYMLNKNYTYIGMPTKTPPVLCNAKEIYLFDNESCPLNERRHHSKTMLASVIRRFVRVTTGKKCLNNHAQTALLIGVDIH
jgi:hypothetical protein